MASPVSEYSDEQVGAAVDDLRVAGELRRGVDEAADAYDAFHFSELAELVFQRGKQGERGGPRRGVGVFFGGIAADLAGDDFAVGAARNVAGEEDERAAAYGGNVIGDGGTDGRKREAERGELLLGRGCGGGWGAAGAQRQSNDEDEQQAGEGCGARVHGASVQTRPRVAS